MGLFAQSQLAIIPDKDYAASRTTASRSNYRNHSLSFYRVHYQKACGQFNVLLCFCIT
jgi:hypothetical protein